MKKDIEFQWQENVKAAKELSSKKDGIQMEIARLALEVCEISWGGGHMAGKYTLRRFSEESGISAKTLSSYIVVRRKVYEKLPSLMARELNYTRMQEIALRVPNEATKKQVATAAEKVINMDRTEMKILKYIQDLRSLAYNFGRTEAAERVSKQVKEEILFYCDIITRAILTDPTIKPKDNHLASKTNIQGKNRSAAEIMGATKGNPNRSTRIDIIKDEHGEVRITPKDRQIIAYVKSQPGFCSPTEIGMRIGKHNSNSASAWACRTLNKLLSLKMVERNSRGLYKWVSE